MMSKKKNSIKKYKKISVILLKWKFACLAGILFFIFGNVYVHTHPTRNNYDSSLTGDEAAETQQNTIPTDVLGRIQQESHVLGINSSLILRENTVPVPIRVPILMYHYVEYVQDPRDTIRISLNITPYSLEQEIKTLSDAGFTFMTNAELTDVLNGKRSLPSKPILLTFDDGYRDFYTDAYPILKKYHAKATQYVIAGFLDQPNHLLTSQLQEIAKDGLVEIGAHTVHHVWLKGQSVDTIQYEVGESKKILERIIHKPVLSFAYPFGAFDLNAIDAVEKAGFTSATSTIPGIDHSQTNRYFLSRLRPGGLTGDNLLFWLRTMK